MYKIIAFVCILVYTVIAAPAGPAEDGTAQITNYNSSVNPDGSYAYQFDTSNGINVQESGTATGAVQGAAQYTSPEGDPIQLNYVADENGFQPTGAHIPAVPEYITRALEYIRAHPPPEDSSNPKSK